MRFRKVSTNILELDYSVSTELVAYTDPFSINFFDKIENYSYHDDVLTKMPGKYPLYQGQEKYNIESEVYSKLATEDIMHHGVVCEYYVTTYNREADPVWGEDCDRRAVRKFDFMIDPDGNLPKQRYTIDMWGIGEMEVGNIYTTKRHFAEASTKAGVKTEDNGLDSGFQIDTTKTFESITPKTGDIVKLKNDDQFYEILFVGDRENEEFLQRKHYWNFTVKRFRDDQITVSDEQGLGEAMSDLGMISDRKGVDEFDLTEEIRNSIDERLFDTREEKVKDKPKLDDAVGSESIGELGRETVDDWFN